MQPLTGHHHVSLSVSDRDRSVAWYTKVLGFRELFREEADDRRASVLAFAEGSYSVGLVEHRPTRDGAFDARQIGLDHVAFTVATRSALDDWTRVLDDHGVVHSGVIEIAPGAIVNLKDPDGIAVALFWDRG